MLKKYSNFRTFSDNVKLGSLTALSAGMVNVISVIVFFAFTSNVTGHFTILAQEITKGNWYQASVVFIWVAIFCFGNFASNYLIIHSSSRISRYLAHAIPVILEIVCLIFVGIYLQHFYKETLEETEILVALMLFAMGLQNGLTASISNSMVKTTHLTGLVTDLSILLSMFTKKEYRENKELVNKARLLMIILISYMAGGIIAGILYYKIQSYTFYAISFVLCIVILYDYSKLRLQKYISRKQPLVRKHYIEEETRELNYNKNILQMHRDY
ncbi:MAG: DUF1275 domain-containing protein [Chitinophagaceae bacterium]|nr:DUF1275 domain-containing protein [Chitinophagaceae bacterium]